VALCFSAVFEIPTYVNTLLFVSNRFLSPFALLLRIVDTSLASLICRCIAASMFSFGSDSTASEGTGSGGFTITWAVCSGLVFVSGYIFYREVLLDLLTAKSA